MDMDNLPRYFHRDLHGVYFTINRTFHQAIRLKNFYFASLDDQFLTEEIRDKYFSLSLETFKLAIAINKLVYDCYRNNPDFDRDITITGEIEDLIGAWCGLLYR